MNEVPSTLPAALDITQKFSAIFGYEIISSKPSLLPPNESMLEAQLPSDISIVEHFCYSGIEIYPNLETTITKKYKNFRILQKRIMINGVIQMYRWRAVFQLKGQILYLKSLIYFSCS